MKPGIRNNKSHAIHEDPKQVQTNLDTPSNDRTLITSSSTASSSTASSSTALSSVKYQDTTSILQSAHHKEEEQQQLQLFNACKKLYEQHREKLTLQNCFSLILYHYLYTVCGSNFKQQEVNHASYFAVFTELQKQFRLEHFSIPEELPSRYSHAEVQELILSSCTSMRLGRLYEYVYHGKGNHRGVYYTPPTLASRMTEEILEELSSFPYCLDPACGTGIFLLILGKELKKKNATQSPEHTLSHLHGIDCDIGAVSLCRTLLCLSLTRSPSFEHIKPLLKIVQNTIQCADTLSRNKAPGVASVSHKAFPAGGFDLVIGNPPYGLSRDERMSSDELKRYSKEYSSIKAGKLNKYMMFIDRARDFLSPRGFLHVVVPNSWLGIRSAKKLRKLLLTDFPLQKISLYPKGTLGDPSLEPLVLTATTNNDASCIEIRNHLLSSNHPYADIRIPHQRCLERPEFIIPLYWDSPVAALLGHLEEQSVPLSEHPESFQARIALQAYARGKGSPPQTAEIVKTHPFHTKEAIDEHSIPYLQGKDIKRFSITWSGDYLHYGPWLAEPQSLDRFTGPRILLREILAPFPYVLQAACTNKAYLYNKSVLHILPGDNTQPESIGALLLLMTSAPGSMQWLLSGRKSQRTLFPKIVNGDVQSFRVPVDLHHHDVLTVARSLCDHRATPCEEEIEQAALTAYDISGTIHKSYQRIHKALSSLSL